MSAQKENLTKFRQQIDAIDDQIVALLKSRLEIVKEVGRHKSQHSTTQSFIRAGREATMLRDLARKMDGTFPAAAIANIWRMIISASLATEQNMSIAAYVTESDQTCYWHAREYYGSFIKTTCESSATDVIRKVAGGESSIGILPLRDNSKSPWWVRPSAEKNDIYIFARIPFVEPQNSFDYPTLAIANVMPEPTGEDLSLLSVSASVPKTAILSAFTAQGLTATIIAEAGGTDHLVEINSFLEPENPVLDSIRGALADATIRLMGAYAAPIRSACTDT